MPTISVFYGIAIRMYFDEHAPPHFHAYYGAEAAMIDIGTGAVREGSLPRRALRLVREWTALHRDGLLANWEFAREHRPLQSIDPLD